MANRTIRSSRLAYHCKAVLVPLIEPFGILSTAMKDQKPECFAFSGRSGCAG
jgi:hypothetical protein